MHTHGKPEENRLLGGSIHSWEDNIKIDVGEILWEGVNCLAKV
jgi:hypothetical protein